MTQSLFDSEGNRKYLVTRERLAFVRAAIAEGGEVTTFCLTLAITGARISEVLALTRSRIDAENSAIVFETLKQRKKGIFRAVPVPRRLLSYFEKIHGVARPQLESGSKNVRLWPWGRTHAWKQVKRIMKIAGIADSFAKPKALRHGFGVEAGQNGVPQTNVQRWMGHARLETTSIYMHALGDEERNLARRAWSSLVLVIPDAR
ncbi:MAG: site-specific integrase [Rhizomicrobium sp.]|nr:site-specific integrase [Rhizomicrobium sp.]